MDVYWKSGEVYGRRRRKKLRGSAVLVGSVALVRVAEPVASSGMVWRVSQGSSWPRSEEASRMTEVFGAPPVRLAEMRDGLPGPAGVMTRLDRTGGVVMGAAPWAVRTTSFPVPPV